MGTIRMNYMMLFAVLASFAIFSSAAPTLNADALVPEPEESVLITEGSSSKKCQDYFGASVNNTDMIVSVVDIDVLGPQAKSYCDSVNNTAPCTFIHHAGPGSQCITPAPPDEGICHRYIKNMYSQCDAMVASATNFVQQ